MAASKHPRLILILILIAGALIAVGVTAQEEGEAPPADAAAAGPPDEGAPETGVSEPEIEERPEKEVVVVTVGEEEVPPELATPQSCYRTYRDAMLRATEGETGALGDAAACLDLSGISALIRKDRGSELVRMLARILDYSPQVDPESLPVDPVGLPVTILERPEGSIEIGMCEDGAWRFTSRSVEAIPEIFREMEVAGEFERQDIGREPEEMLSGGRVGQELGLRSLIPASWKSRTFLLEDWQWLYLLLIVLIACVLDRLVPRIVGAGIGVWLRNTFLKDRKELFASTSRPFGFLAAAVFLWLALVRSGLDEGVLVVLLTTAKLLTTAAIVWCAYRAVDIVSEFIERRAARTSTRMDDLLAPFMRKTLKVLVTIFGLVFIASNLGMNVTTLIAGLGIGGIAVALAAKDTIENLFGSVTILFDSPFQVGDWVVIGDVEGTVEELGFRSTRIRTFYNSIITVPNSALISANVDNLGIRRYRRIKAMLALTYSTPPEKVEAFCEGVRELVRKHPYTRKDSYHVWLNEFGPSSLDVLLYCFLETPDWATELRERHRLFLDIIRLANDLGVQFAFPTRTVVMTQESPAQPVFPETGTISAATEGASKDAKSRAEKIAQSQLGGDDVIPGPVRFDETGGRDTGGFE